MDRLITEHRAAATGQATSAARIDALLREFLPMGQPAPFTLLMSKETARTLRRLVHEGRCFRAVHRIGKHRFHFARTRNGQKVVIRRCA